jgi:hypothetical protein
MTSFRTILYIQKVIKKFTQYLRYTLPIGLMTQATLCVSVYTGKTLIGSIYVTNFLVAELEGSKHLKLQVLIGRLHNPAAVSFIVTNCLPYIYSILPSRSFACLHLSQKEQRGDKSVG